MKIGTAVTKLQSGALVRRMSWPKASFLSMNNDLHVILLYRKVKDKATCEAWAIRQEDLFADDWTEVKRIERRRDDSMERGA